MNNRKLCYFFLLLAATFWGTSFTAGKLAMDGIDPTLVTLGRFLIASVFLMPRFIKGIRPIIDNKKLLKKLLLSSFLYIPVIFLLQFIGLSYTSSSSGVIIIGMGPLLINIIGHFFWNEKLKLSNILASFSALAGIAMIMGNPVGISYFGCFLIFLSIVAVGFWLKISSDMIKIMRADLYTSIIIILGTILLLPFLFLVRNWHINWSFSNFSALVYLGIVCSLLASIFWNKGMMGVESNKGALFLSLEPVFGVILGVFYLHEPITRWGVFGTLLVIFPILIISARDFTNTSTNKQSVN